MQYFVTNDEDLINDNQTAKDWFLPWVWNSITQEICHGTTATKRPSTVHMQRTQRARQLLYTLYSNTASFWPQMKDKITSHPHKMHVTQQQMQNQVCIHHHIISGFGIYGAAVVPDSGVGNTWQRLTLVLHEFKIINFHILLSASLYVSKRGAYWDRLCRDVVGWLSRACTVAKRCILGL